MLQRAVLGGLFQALSDELREGRIEYIVQNESLEHLGLGRNEQQVGYVNSVDQTQHRDIRT